MKNLKAILGYGVTMVASALVFVWYCLAGLTMKAPSVLTGGKSMTESTKVWDVLKEEGVDSNKFTTSNSFAIIALVLACILIVTSILGLLNSMGVIKLGFMPIVNYVVAGLFLVASIVAFACMMSYASEMAELMTGGLDIEGFSFTAGIGYILTMVSSVVAVAGVVVGSLGSKK